MRAVGRTATWCMAIAACAHGMATVACAPSMVPARVSDGEPVSAREREAERRIQKARCGAANGLIFPGVGQACQGRAGESAVLGGLATAELATAVGVAVHEDRGWAGFEHPAAAIPLVAVQDLWLIGYADAYYEEQRARRMRYVPQEKLSELVVAPFNPRVLSSTDVWVGIPLMVAAGVGVSVLAGEPMDTKHAGDDPNLFGRTVDRAWGYPAAGAVGVAVFTHVAMGEEMTFRGLIQSSMAREMDETSGWAGASLAFGALHATNVPSMPRNERERYLFIGVPFITMVGSYMGLSYRWNRYSLSAPIAIHFWYDLLLSAAYFAADPTSSPLSARVVVPF